VTAAGQLIARYKNPSSVCETGCVGIGVGHAEIWDHPGVAAEKAAWAAGDGGDYFFFAVGGA